MSAMDGPGMSALFVALLTFYSSSGWLDGLNVVGTPFQLKLVTNLGDYESIRALFGSPGASAIGPCCLCMNVLAKGRVEAERDEYFITIEEASSSKFQHYVVDELHSVCDRYLRALPNLSRRQAEEEEKIFGWNVHPGSLMAKPDLREILSLKHLMLDSCRCYFNNGCVSQEVVLFMEFLSKHHSIHLEDIQREAVSVKWHRSYRQYRGIGHLFHPSLWTGSCHKGDASASWYLPPLLGFYGFELLEDQDPLAWQCFKALLKADSGLHVKFSRSVSKYK